MNQVKAGAFLNYVIIALNTVVGLAYTPYMLRCLGQNEYGLYSLVASIIAYLTLLDFGFGNAIIRYTAKFRAENKHAEQWEMFGMFLIIYTIIGIISFAGGLCLYFNVDTLFDRTMSTEDLAQAQTMMLLLSVNLAFTFPMSVFGAVITAYENFVFQRVINILRILLSTGVMILVLAMGYKAVALVVIQTIFNLLTLLVNYVYCKEHIKIQVVFHRFNWPFIKDVATYSFWIFLNAIMDKIYWGTGQFVLGAISGTIAVAIFSIAILFQQMYMQFSVAISNVLLPRLTSMVALNHSDRDISNLFIKTGRIQCIILSFITSGFIVFGKQFIELWAGNEYQQSFYIVLIFFISLFVPLIQNTGISILQARNQLKFRSCLYLVISLTSLYFQILLANKYGAMGCAMAIGIALIIGQGIIMNIYYACRQHIDITKFWGEILKMSITPIALTVLGVITTIHFSISNVSRLLLGIILFSCVYMSAVWRLSLNHYERELIISPIKRFLPLRKH